MFLTLAKKKMAASMNVQEINWLYPDLLSTEGLRFILQQRYIRPAHSDLEDLQKEELVELYNRYILPLPQRSYRNNLRGQEMTRKQLLFDKKFKRKSSDAVSGQSSAKKEKTDGPSSGLVNHLNSPGSVGTRLKPPPSAVNFEKKVVKLNSSKPVQGTASETDGIVINPWNKKADGSLAVVSSSETASSAGHADNCDQPKKRLHCSLEIENNPDGSAEDLNHSPAKKTIAKITWP